MNRVISSEEERAVRLCHHDHEGKTIESAAATMGVTTKEVRRLLRCAKYKAPQLFPILTPQHRAILAMYAQGISRDAITEGLGITLPMLVKRVAFLRKHGHLQDRKMVRYRPHMDNQVKEKF